MLLTIDKKDIATKLKNDIESYCANAYDSGPREHLGASLIGNSCERKLWFQFRWVKHEKFSGRMQRLFNRGHREEARFIEWLRGIGCIVLEFEKTLWYHPESDSYFIEKIDYQLINKDIDAQHCIDVGEDNSHINTARVRGVDYHKGKQQFRISGAMGHFGGSLDAIVFLPERYGIKEPLLAEFKTNGTGRGFNDVSAKGVKIAKPVHYVQTCTYAYKFEFEYEGVKYKFKHLAYFNINKNDDDLHVEIEELDYKVGEHHEKKAERIIFSQSAPEGVSKSSAYYECKGCNYHEFCFGKGVCDKNCRSCVNAEPVENAEWKCNVFNAVIPENFIKQACDNWDAIA